MYRVFLQGCCCCCARSPLLLRYNKKLRRRRRRGRYRRRRRGNPAIVTVGITSYSQCSISYFPLFHRVPFSLFSSIDVLRSCLSSSAWRMTVMALMQSTAKNDSFLDGSISSRPYTFFLFVLYNHSTSSSFSGNNIRERKRERPPRRIRDGRVHIYI